MGSAASDITRMVLRGRRHLAGDDTSTGGDNSGNAVDTAMDYANQIKTGTTDLATTNPREWTSDQYLALATGLGAFWTIALLVCILKGCCDKRRRNKRKQEDDAFMNMSFADNKAALLDQNDKARNDSSTHKYQMAKPMVTKSPVPLSSLQTDFDATDPGKLPLGARLHGANKLGKNGLSGFGVRVAIIDSGIDHAHPGLHDKVRTKRWFRHGTPLDEDDHGTHVAGTIHFMAPGADLYDYRVFGREGDFDGDLAIAKSIRSAVDVDKCHVINMSLRCSYPVRPEIKKAIKHAYKKGVHVVCAAGNDGDGDPSTNEKFTFPAQFDETISVAAVRKEPGLPAADFSESNTQVTYSGIGTNVISLKPFGGFQRMSGTSMATPHVTGLIAALLSNNNTKLTDKELRKLIQTKHLVDIGAKGFDRQTGKGFATYLAGADGNDELSELLPLVE